MADHMEGQVMNRLWERLVERVTDVIRNTNDTVFTDESSARAFLGCSELFFRKYYRDQCGFKQGNARCYRKSDLLERYDQLRMQGIEDHEDDAKHGE